MNIDLQCENDYFRVVGYKKLAAQILATNAEDLLCDEVDPQNAKKRKAALEWLDATCAPGESFATFSDCISAIGFVSRESFWREQMKGNPSAVLQGMRHIVQTVDGGGTGERGASGATYDFGILSAAWGDDEVASPKNEPELLQEATGSSQ